MDKTASCTVFLNKERHLFLLQSQVREHRFGWVTSFGHLREISSKEMEQNGLSLVLDDLADFECRTKLVESELESYTSRQRHDFLHKHCQVAVGLTADEALELAPMHPQRRGFASHPSEHIRVDLPTSQTQFYAALMQAFARCERH